MNNFRFCRLARALVPGEGGGIGELVLTNAKGGIPSLNEFSNAVPAKEAVATFCRRHHIRRLALFGSVLRDDFTDRSDIDVLVEFEPGHVPGFFRLVDMESEFSGLCGGRRADLRTPEDLSRYFRDDVLAEARVQYAES